MSIVGLVLSVAVFLFLINAADEGMDTAAMGQTAALTLAFAAVPLATLIRQVSPSAVFSLGGGMTVAGVATTPGGNLLGIVMIATGLAFLLVGAAASPLISPGLVGWLVVYAVAITASIWVIGTSPWTWLISILVSGAVVPATRVQLAQSP